jgi:hypothetical protein
MYCKDCKYWGDGDGKGIHYDAGHVGYCNQPQIGGDQHPSYGACGDPISMLIAEGVEKQYIQTRLTFGCILFEQKTK